MGEKKKKEETVARWKQVVVITACVLFVVLMVVSGMGYGWLSMFSSVKPGQTAVIEFTLYDGSGNPVITSSESVYKKAVADKKNILVTKQVAIVANQSPTTTLYPVTVYNPGTGETLQFALFAPEYTALTSAIVGMRTNEQKTIALPSSSTMSQLWSKEQLEMNGVNMDDVNVGDVFGMGVSDNPEEMSGNTSAKTYMRLGEITRKTTTGIVVDFGYPTADIRVISFSGNN